MNTIHSPLTQSDAGSDVADLQDALTAALKRALLEVDPSERDNTLAQLTEERAARTYGETTARLVSLTQEHFGMHASGEVDDATAAVLNNWLRDQGLIDHGDGDGTRSVEGRVLFPDGRPAAERRVVAYSV